MSEPRDVLIRHAGRRRVQGGAVSIGRAGRGRTECRHWSEGGRWIWSTRQQQKGIEAVECRILSGTDVAAPATRVASSSRARRLQSSSRARRAGLVGCIVREQRKPVHPCPTSPASSTRPSRPANRSSNQHSTSLFASQRRPFMSCSTERCSSESMACADCLVGSQWRRCCG